MNLKHIRWQQRFENFESCFKRLHKAVSLEKLSDLERAGSIQLFELTFELAWKTLKDYLESEGYNVKSPRETIKQAYQSEMIDDGHGWLQMLEQRNILTHIYNEEESVLAETKIKNDFFPLLENMHITFKKKRTI